MRSHSFMIQEGPNIFSNIVYMTYDLHNCRSKLTRGLVHFDRDTTIGKGF